KKGGKVSGVITNESQNSIEIKSNLGTIVLSKSAIARIERSKADENTQLQTQWQREREEEKEKLKKAKLFEDDQRSKGMVKYQGTWVSVEKAYEVEKGFAKEKEEWEKTVEQQKREFQDMEKRIKDLEARMEQRQRDIDYREQQLGLREQNLLLQQQNLQRQAEQMSREKQQAPPKIFAVPRIEVFPPPPSD
ncbi:MAG: hypothetical protein NT045_07555, partial [Candidatus Aureabacteria bacterium]|nr:hypothetical protein [Candidatus Auribacterota bacterium]